MWFNKQSESLIILWELNGIQDRGFGRLILLRFAKTTLMWQNVRSCGQMLGDIDATGGYWLHA